MAGNPTLSLFNTLLSTMVAILTGFFCIRFKLLTPAEGHLKGLGFFIGSMVFPLLIFNTVATAELHSVNYGVIAACSLGKVAVMILTWLLAYLMYQRKRSRGQRILTASVFAFFSVASNDFAIGFPVIDALYEKDMSIYITGNALVGSFVFIPLTMVAFAIGGAIRTGEGQSTWKIFKDILYDLSTNPVIFMTCSGLLYKIILGSSIVEENGKLQLPHPLSDFVTLFTSPFAMSALFLTGTALRSPRISAWAIGMVLMKVVVCAYLSYFFGTLFLRGEHNKPLRDFTFFYGAIPTSSAPIVFANQFDPDAAELVATAVLFGLVLAGPIMFITAYSLNQEDESTSMVILREAQLSADAASILAGLGFCVCLGVLRQYWCFTCPAKQLLAVYGIVLTAYAAVSFYINPSTFIPSTTCEDFKEMDLRTPSVVVFSWLQNSASCLLLVLQFFYVCGPKVSSNAPLKGLAFVSGCLLFALMPAFLATPNTINEICGHEEFNSLQLCLNVIWSCTKLAVALSLALYAICKKGPPRDGGSESTESESETDSEDLPARTNSDLEKNSREWEILVPRGVILTITIMNIVKVLTQVINAALVHFAFDENAGSFASMLLLESMLEHGQIIVLMAALFFDPHFSALLLKIARSTFPWCRSRKVTWMGWSLIRQRGPQDCELEETI